jgi:hypothetical protein
MAAAVAADAFGTLSKIALFGQFDSICPSGPADSCADMTPKSLLA